MKGKQIHHRNGCSQAMRKEHDGRPPNYPRLRIGMPGVEWWNKSEGALVRIIGPKDGTVDDWALVTCCNCLARRARAEREGPRWEARHQ